LVKVNYAFEFYFFSLDSVLDLLLNLYITIYGN
jgi:hypothetical protein